MPLVIEPLDKASASFHYSFSDPSSVLFGQLLLLFLLIVKWHVNLKVVSHPSEDSDSARLNIALLLLVSFDIVDCLVHLQGCRQVDPCEILQRLLVHRAQASDPRLHQSALMAH